MSKDLTDAQKELFDWIRGYIFDFQHSPSIRQMMQGMGLKSPAPIQSRLKHLQEKGYISWQEGKARTLKLVDDFVEKTDNIFKAVSVMAKRSAQVNEKMKEELMAKLDEFALSQDQLDEVFENQEQIAVSKFYEGLPKPWAIAMQELLTDKIYMRDTESDESVGDVNQNA